MKTQKAFEWKILFIDTEKIEAVLSNIETFVSGVNKGFVPVFLENEVEPTTELLHNLMAGQNVIPDIIAAKIDKDISSLGRSGQLIKDLLLQAHEQIRVALEKEVKTLLSVERSLSRYTFNMTGISPGIYSKVIIVGGKAVMSPTAVDEVTKMLTITIETPQQQKGYDILMNIAEQANTINGMSDVSLRFVHGLTIDDDYFNICGGEIVVNPSVIKHFN